MYDMGTHTWLAPLIFDIRFHSTVTPTCPDSSSNPCSTLERQRYGRKETEAGWRSPPGWAIHAHYGIHILVNDEISHRRAQSAIRALAGRRHPSQHLGLRLRNRCMHRLPYSLPCEKCWYCCYLHLNAKVKYLLHRPVSSCTAALSEWSPGPSHPIQNKAAPSDRSPSISSLDRSLR